MTGLGISHVCSARIRVWRTIAQLLRRIVAPGRSGLREVQFVHELVPQGAQVLDGLAFVALLLLLPLPLLHSASFGAPLLLSLPLGALRVLTS